MSALPQIPVVRTSIQTRFADFDALGHLNNAKYLEYVEIARVHTFADVLGVDLRKITAVMGTATISFLRPIRPFEPLILETAITEVRPRSIDFRVSFVVENEPDKPRAIIEARQVVVDTRSGQVCPVPDYLAGRISELSAGRLEHPAVGCAVLV